MNNYINLLLLFVLLLIASCSRTSDVNEFTGHKFEMNFLNIDTFENQDWIEVDGLRFVHLNEMNELQNTPWSLAASTIYLNSESMPDRTSSYPGLSIGIDFGNYLAGLNKNETMQADHDYSYEVLNHNLLLSMGKLIFMRSDSSKFTVRVSPDYPIQINIVE